MSGIEFVFKVSGASWRRTLAWAARATLRAVRRQGRLTIALVGDREMQAMNAKYRRRRRTTDVLSFPGADGRTFPAPPGQAHLGDVMISLPEARRRARQQGIMISDELRLLAVHGVLHCLGYDHERPADANKMLPLQEKILKTLRSER